MIYDVRSPLFRRFLVSGGQKGAGSVEFKLLSDLPAHAKQSRPLGATGSV